MTFGVLRSAEEIAESIGYLGPAEGELGGFYAAAPRTGQHAINGNAVRSERFADASRVQAAGVGKVALRSAVVEPHPRRVTRAGRGHGMADEDNLAAGLQKRPQLLIGQRRRSLQPRKREREAGALQPASTKLLFRLSCHLHHGAQCFRVGAPAQALNGGLGSRRDDRMVAPFLACVAVGDVYLDDRERHGFDGVVQGHAELRQARRIENRARGAVDVLVQEIDERAFVVGLNDGELDAEFLAQLLELPRMSASVMDP